jgi:hypothetical protein
VIKNIWGILKMSKPSKTKKKLSMSEIISEYAAEFIAGGNDINEKQNYLNCACTAWNISLYPVNLIEQKINKVVTDYEKNNPGTNDSKKYRHNLKQLIERKIELYPDVRKTVVEAIIKEHNRNFQIMIASMPLSK